jgi:hypothetical protein
MRIKTSSFSLFFFFLLSWQSTHAQDDSDTVKTETRGIERLTYQQQPGLAMAASKIYFSERPFSISGFGEASFVNYLGPKDTESGDLELFYTNLYRFATFFGYRLRGDLIWNSELQIEYLHDGSEVGRTEFLFEAFLDYLWKDYMKFRVGYFPLPIGYVNNNDEPIMFYSVNRSEVERLITPTTWIEFGGMFYGNITPDLRYAVGVSQGLNAAEYLNGSWIRQGRVITWGLPKALSFTPQLTYTGFPNLELSASGFFGNSGQEHIYYDNEGPQELKAPVRIGTGYAKYERENWRFVTVGTYGSLGQTSEIAGVTLRERGVAQIMGERTMGYLFELGHDLLPYFNRKKSEHETWLYNPAEFKLPVFVRFERLNTHHRLDPTILPITCPTCLPLPVPSSLVQNNLRIWTLGLNFNTRENIVMKANYQFRKNMAIGPNALEEGNRIEFGFGFIF